MRTQSASRRWQRAVTGLVSLSLPALALAYTMGAFGPRGVWAAAPKVASFEFQPLAGDTAQGDGLADSASWDYADYRVAHGSAPVCVDAEVGPGSFGFHVLNRKMDDAGTRCSDVGGTTRQYQVIVSDSVACAELSAYDSRYVDLDLDGTGDPNSPCRLNGADNPRIRLSDLWANKLPAATQVAFLISSFNPPFPQHGGFEIKSNSAATVTGTSSVRTVSYVGTASLVKFVIGEKTKAVGGTFPLRLHMAFEKFTP